MAPAKGGLLPIPKEVVFFRPQLYERVEILQVEVYESVGKFVITAVCEKAQKG